MTNYEQFMACDTPEKLVSAIFNLKSKTPYLNGKIIRINENPMDLLSWMKKEADDFDNLIFCMREKKISLHNASVPYDRGMTLIVPFYYEDKDIASIFEKKGMKYDPETCTYSSWE